MNVYARVTTDGYLLYSATDDEYTGSDSYWPDYYTDGFDTDEVATVVLNDVPTDLVGKLCEQGGSEQVFADGYEAWQAALPYWKGGA